MHAAVVTDYAKPPVFAEFRDPDVGEGQIEVEVLASGVHQLVRSIAAGRHYSSDGSLPFIPGVDGVARRADGSRIYTGATHSPFGMLAERAAVPAGWAIPIPDALESTVAAAIVNPALSSLLPLDERLNPGATVLILGATGASGTLAVQLAKRLGAGRVIAAGRNPDALRRTRELGADATISVGGELSGALRDAAPDGVDLVLDYVWGPVAEATLSALAANGVDPQRPVQYVEIGALAGDRISLDAAVLRSASIEIAGSGIGSIRPARVVQLVSTALALAAADDITIEVDTHPLSDVAAVWDRPTRLVFEP
jgi:NADPH:quinone reductase-like Zn-dependent oxidoreductase